MIFYMSGRDLCEHRLQQHAPNLFVVSYSVILIRTTSQAARVCLEAVTVQGIMATTSYLCIYSPSMNGDVW